MRKVVDERAAYQQGKLEVKCKEDVSKLSLICYHLELKLAVLRIQEKAVATGYGSLDSRSPKTYKALQNRITTDIALLEAELASTKDVLTVLQKAHEHVDSTTK